jgi:hypothetical protein
VHACMHAGTLAPERLRRRACGWVGRRREGDDIPNAVT